MGYAATLEEHRRLAVLIHLSACLDYASNSEILFDVVNGVGITTSRDQLTETLAWLREQDMVSIEDHEGFLIVEATARGVDVAQGRALVPGVRRPAPKRASKGC